MAQQALMLNRVDKEPPSAPDVGKADSIELQEIAKNTARSDVTYAQTPRPGQTTQEHQGFAQSGSGKKVELQQCTEQEKHKFAEI